MPLEPPLNAPFARLAAAACPANDEMLVAVEREPLAVDRRRHAHALDELSRPLFESREAPARERVGIAVTLAWEALPQSGLDPASWLLDSALAHGRAAAPIRAVSGRSSPAAPACARARCG